MTDIFLSYSGKDRTRVQPLFDSLRERDFDVFWDQEIPPGTDWDTWIRQHLNDAKCAVVVWSAHSILSDNVRHEASIAKVQRKLVSVLIDAIAPDQLPMGLYSVQASNLSRWTGSIEDEDWIKLLHEIESRLMPGWVRKTLDAKDAEMVAERARRETAERRDRTFRDQIAKEAAAQQRLRVELDEAQGRIDDLSETARSKAADYETASARLIRLTEEFAVTEERRRVLEEENRVAKGAIAELQERIAGLERVRAKELDNGHEAMRPAEETRAVNVSSSTLFGSRSAEEREITSQANADSDRSDYDRKVLFGAALAVAGLILISLLSFWR